jgi:hypothetical protein
MFATSLLAKSVNPTDPLVVNQAVFAAKVRARAEAIVANPSKRITTQGLQALTAAVDMAEKRVGQL